MRIWTKLITAIGDWHDYRDPAPYPLQGNAEIMRATKIRTFENLFKVWSDNVPVRNDHEAMRQMRDHRRKLALTLIKDPDV